MSSDYKINNSLFSSLNEMIKNPFIVMDNVGNILSRNNEAKLLFNLDQLKNNIYDKLDDPSSELLNGLVEKLFSSQGPIVQLANLKLRDGGDIRGELLLNSYNEENEYFIFLSLKKNEVTPLSAFSEVSILNNDIRDIITNENILNVIEEIRASYPFSLIGRESFRKKIDGLEEIVWIEDAGGKYVIVNHNLSKYAGVQVQQMEGKQVNKFLLPVLSSLYNSINEFIKESGNSILIKGIPFKGSDKNNLYDTIKFPLFDPAQKIIAFVGITQKIVKKREELPLQLDLFPRAAALINKNDEIIQFNNRFPSLLEMDSKFMLNKPYKDVFQGDLILQIEDFQAEIRKEIKININGKISAEMGNSATFNVYLNKIYNSSNESEGFLIIIEEVSTNDDFENLFRKRGRMFDILIQNNPEPIFIYDTENLRFLEVNNATLNLYGYRKEEFLQMDLTDLYTPEDIQTLLDSSNSADKFGKFAGPYRHKRKDGSSVFVEISKIQFKFMDKDAHFNIIKDVTQKLETEKKNQLYKSAFDNFQNLFFVTDNSGFITYVNKAVIDTLNIAKTDIEGTSFATLVKNEERGTISTTVLHAHLNDPVSLNMELKKSDGTFIDTELTATPILNYKNEVDSFTIIGKIEPPVVVKEVVKEVEAGNPVYQSGKTSQSVKEMDENFLSSMFHEILTPINVIIGFVQELTENAQNITPEQKEAVDIINQNRTTLLNTMNSIIEFSGIEKERFDLNPQDISITEIIDYLQKDIEELSGTRGVDFAYGKISSSLRFESDKKKFQHLISLLLNISTQLTKDKKIYFSAYQQEQDSFVISIKDSYSSVSKYLLGNLKYIFEGNNIESGKDLGVSRLTIRLVKKLFGMLNGEFRILSTGDKADYGFIFPLKFSFVPKEEKILEKSHVVIDEEISPAIVYESKPEIPELPMPEKRLGFRQNVNEEFTKDKTIEKPKSKKLTDQGFQEVPSSKIIVSKYNIGEPEIEEPVKIDDEISQLAKDIKEIKPYSKSTKLDLSQMSCLYIEDQIDSQILFKVQMKEMKEIKFAVSFEEALPLLDNGHFDIIVMDINLQGEYNGLDALKIIHKMPVYEKIPIIAVTAYVLPGDKEKFIATGFNDFISKPIFREKMIDSLERIFMMQM